MESKRFIAAFLVCSFLFAGCSVKKEETADSRASDEAEVSVTTEQSEETPETSESSDKTVSVDRSSWVDDGDGSQFISDCHFDVADKVQNQGYIPLKPEEVLDDGVRKYATELYAKGYSLCSLEYMGYAMAGCAIIDPTEPDGKDYRYFNDGISAELMTNDGEGDILTNEYYFIRMTEEQFNTIMLYQSSVNLYIYGNDASPVPADYKIPEGTDDGIVRRITSPAGHYIEYHRDTGICVIYIDHIAYQASLPPPIFVDDADDTKPSA